MSVFLNDNGEMEVKRQMMNSLIDKIRLSYMPPMMVTGHAGGMDYGGGGSDGSMVTVYNDLLQITNGTISNKKETMATEISMQAAVHQLKVGDFVETWCLDNPSRKDRGIIAAVYPGSIDVNVEGKGIETGYSANDRVWVLLKPLANKNNTMSLLSKIRGAFEKEPEKSLKHFGFINESGDLTDDGKEVLLNLLFKVNPEIFNEAITKLKDEEEAAKK